MKRDENTDPGYVPSDAFLPPNANPSLAYLQQGDDSEADLIASMLGLNPQPAGMADSLKARSNETQPSPMGMADSLMARSQEASPTPPSGMADSLPARAGFGMGGDTASSSQSANPVIPTAATKSIPTVQDMISKLYGGGLDDSALQDAQKQANMLRLMGGMTQAGAQIGAALSKGAIKPDYTAAENITKMAETPVSDIMARRQAKMQGLQAGTLLSDLADKEQQRDPNSDLSKQAQAMAKALNLNVPEGLSYEGITKLQPMIDTYMKMEAIKTEKTLALQNKKDSDLNKSESDLGTRVEQLFSLRGPAGRAEIVKQGADRLLTYAKMYGNRNNLTPPEVSMIAYDLGTIMRGGTATEGGVKSVMPGTLASEFAGLEQKITNNPTGADLGAFVKRMEKGATELRSVADKYSKEQANYLIDSYKSRLRPDYYQAQKDKFAIQQDQPTTAIGDPSAAMAEIKRRQAMQQGQ